MANIFPKSSTVLTIDKTLVLDPKQGLVYPSPFDSWEELRLGFFFSFNPKNKDNSSNLVINTSLIYPNGNVPTDYNYAVSPNGTMDAFRVRNTISAFSYFSYMPSVPANTSGGIYTTSFYGKPDGPNGLLIFEGLGGYPLRCNIDIVTGTFSSTTSLSDFGSQDVGNGWRRYWFTATITEPPRNQAVYIGGYPITTSQNSILLWGFQVEQGAIASPYNSTNGITRFSELEDKKWVTCDGNNSDQFYFGIKANNSLFPKDGGNFMGFLSDSCFPYFQLMKARVTLPDSTIQSIGDAVIEDLPNQKTNDMETYDCSYPNAVVSKSVPDSIFIGGAKQCMDAGYGFVINGESEVDPNTQEERWGNYNTMPTPDSYARFWGFIFEVLDRGFPTERMRIKVYTMNDAVASPTTSSLQSLLANDALYSVKAEIPIPDMPNACDYPNSVFLYMPFCDLRLRIHNLALIKTR